MKIYQSTAVFVACTYAIALSCLLAMSSISCMAEMRTVPKSEVRAIEYSDLVDHVPSFWQACKGKCFHERVSIMCGYELQDGEEICIALLGVPHRDGSKTTLNLCIAHKNGAYTVDCYDEFEKCCLSGSIAPQSAHLNSLRTDSFVLTERRSITGTTAMQVWDALWEYCGSSIGTLFDQAMYDDYVLKALLPYVTGCSWYMKFGYQPKSSAPEEYAAAVDFLAQRSVCEVISKHRNNSLIFTRLTRGLALFGFSESITIGEYIKTLYNSWRYGLIDERSRKICAQSLKNLCIHVLQFSLENGKASRCQELILESTLKKPNLFL